MNIKWFKCCILFPTSWFKRKNRRSFNILFILWEFHTGIVFILIIKWSTCLSFLFLLDPLSALPPPSCPLFFLLFLSSHSSSLSKSRATYICMGLGLSSRTLATYQGHLWRKPSPSPGTHWLSIVLQSEVGLMNLFLVISWTINWTDLVEVCVDTCNYYEFMDTMALPCHIQRTGYYFTEVLTAGFYCLAAFLP